MASSTTQIWCCLVLPAADRGRAVSVRPSCTTEPWVTRQARVVYLSAAAAAAAACYCCSGGLWDMCREGGGSSSGATMCSSSEPTCVFRLTGDAVQRRGKPSRLGCLFVFCCASGGLQCTCAHAGSGWWSAGCSITHTHPPHPPNHPTSPPSAANGLSWCHAAGSGVT